MHYSDLESCTLFSNIARVPVLAVGWLQSGHIYAEGEVDPTIVDRLCALLANPWQPALALGVHQCEYCRLTGGPTIFARGHFRIGLGVNNLFVPTSEVVYVAPSTILHYMDAHEYAPPIEFCDAVMACPPMRSMSYLRLIAQSGLSRR